MRKKILSCLLTLCMVCSLLPMQAMANDNFEDAIITPTVESINDLDLDLDLNTDINTGAQPNDGADATDDSTDVIDVADKTDDSANVIDVADETGGSTDVTDDGADATEDRNNEDLTVAEEENIIAFALTMAIDAFSDEYVFNISKGDISIAVASSGIATVTHGEDKVTIVPKDGMITIEGTTTSTTGDYTITVTGDGNPTVNILLNGVTIEREGSSSPSPISLGNVNAMLSLSGENRLVAYGENPALHVQEGASITIQDYDGTGSLNAKASSAGAIGASADGSYGNITILSGEIIAHSGGGAGIGGGMYEASSHGDITIVSGTVTAMSVEGRGIGHGADTNDAYNTILIKGGTVTAEGDKGGILGKIINIEGGNVTATGREYGINADDLVVSGDTVTAIGGDEGTGIECDNSLDISGGTVTATGGDSGINGDESINISGGTVTATGGDGWAFGINCRTLTIRGAETTITAIAGDTGINVRTFDITKGTVKATGGESGIDGYYINIHGGTVTATGDDAGIEASDHIQIYGGTVTATGSESGLLSDHIAISGGTVTATGDDVGINCGYMFITGGSVKTKEPEILNVDNINENSYDSETGMLNDSDCPTDEEDEDGNSATVWLAIFPATSNGEIITVDDTTTYTLGDLHEGDNHWYLYLTGETHDVKIGKTNYSVTFMATETNDVLYAETGYPSAETGYFAVTEEPSISIEDKVITSGTVGAAYPKDGETSALKATLENLPPEAEATWKWEMTSGNLPDGLTFSSETTDTITITGEPKAEDEQTVTFTVTATLTDGTVLSATQTVTITIGDKLPILDIEGSVVDGKVGKDYPEQQLKVTADVEGELTDVTWTDNGKLPPGLTLNKDGVISGTPTKSGTYTFEVTVVATVNDEEVTTTEEFTIKIESSGGGGGSSKPKPEKEKEPEKEPELVVPNDLNGEDHFAYVVGYPDGTVRPNANITRAEVASIFFRLLNDDVRGTNWTYANDFSDVAESAWYCAPVSTLSDLNIIHGRDNNSFDPSANITRAEFAAIAARFASNDYTRTASFTDISGHWSESNIIKAASHGWIVGDGDGTFRPDDAITRAEAMTLINRVLVRLPEYSSDLLDDMTIWPDNSNVSAWYYLAVQEATNSHNYDMKDSNYESWTSLRADRDWSIYQK